MNIQLSVIIWTIICFSLLMVILNNLLFRPMLKIMDERKKKLALAREKKASYDKILEQRALQKEQLQAQKDLQKKAEIQAALEQIQADEKNLLKEAHNRCLQQVDLYRVQREKELEEILSAVSPRIAQAADIFVQRIVSDRD